MHQAALVEIAYAISCRLPVLAVPVAEMAGLYIDEDPREEVWEDLGTHIVVHSTHGMILLKAFKGDDGKWVSFAARLDLEAASPPCCKPSA